MRSSAYRLGYDVRAILLDKVASRRAVVSGITGLGRVVTPDAAPDLEGPPPLP